MTSELIITRKRINLNDCPILYDRPLSLMMFVNDCEVRNSRWEYISDSLVCKNDKPEPGVMFLKKPFPGNVLVDFYGQTVLPSTHDINVMWNMSWDSQIKKRGPAYVAGVQGWWQGKVGIEKSPEYKLLATAPCPWFEAGKLYHIQAGSIDGHCFLFVDDVLRLELMDPDPIDSSIHNRVGFEAYQSIVKISRIVVRQIVWQEDPQTYQPEF